VEEGDMSRFMDNQYDTAQICLNGHVVNPAIQVTPHYSQDSCSTCGAGTVVKCGDCGTEIRGALLMAQPGGRWSQVGGLRRGDAPPGFCGKCGKPYPWTRATLDAARELSMELLSLEPDERVAMIKSLPDLVSESARTVVAATRFKRLMNKAGAEVGAAFRKILVGAVTEGAKKILWP
jgi:hypothetical protein